jgi:hypothetical protein
MAEQALNIVDRRLFTTMILIVLDQPSVHFVKTEECVSDDKPVA